jgi:flagellar protein FlaG
MSIEPIERAVQARPAPQPVAAPGARSPAAAPQAAQQPQPAQQTQPAVGAAGAGASRGMADDVRRAIEEAGRRLAQKASELTFEFDDASGRVVVKLVDARTREVLRQIPSEEALAIARALEGDTAVGALLRTDA